MTLSLIVSFACYGLVTLFLAIFGMIYLTRRTLMPYHLDALSLTWNDLDAPKQILFMALMRVAGAGFLTTAIAMLILLLIPFRAGEVWAKYAIPVIALAQILPTLYVTILVRKRTPGSPPVETNILGIILLAIGFIASFF